MKIGKKGNNQVAIIVMEGNMVGTCEADQLHQEVQNLLDKNITNIIIDMKDVQWMGSLCIGAIMREVIHARQRNGDVHLASLSRKVYKLFQITKLEGLVNIYPTLHAAKEDFKES